MDRRRALTLIGTVGLTGVAGCLGENGNVEFTASPAAIPSATDAGYVAQGPEAIAVNETIEMAGLSRDVDIETWSAAYSDEQRQTAVFLFSTPDVSVAGVSANPLTRLSGADLIVRVIDQGLGQARGDVAIEQIEQIDETTLTVLGEERTTPVFSAILNVEQSSAGGSSGATGPQAEAIQNGEFPIRLYVLSFTHDGDVLLSVGLHPESIDAREEIVSLMESIEHPAEAANGPA